MLQVKLLEHLQEGHLHAMLQMLIKLIIMEKYLIHGIQMEQQIIKDSNLG